MEKEKEQSKTKLKLRFEHHKQELMVPNHQNKEQTKVMKNSTRHQLVFKDQVFEILIQAYLYDLVGTDFKLKTVHDKQNPIYISKHRKINLVKLMTQDKLLSINKHNENISHIKLTNLGKRFLFKEGLWRHKFPMALIAASIFFILFLVSGLSIMSFAPALLGSLILAVATWLICKPISYTMEVVASKNILPLKRVQRFAEHNHLNKNTFDNLYLYSQDNELNYNRIQIDYDKFKNLKREHKLENNFF